MKLSFERSGDEKRGLIGTGNPDFRLEIVLDDTDRLEAACCLRKLMAVLRDHWDDSAYKSLGAEAFRVDCDEEAEADRRYDQAQAILSALEAGQDNPPE